MNARRILTLWILAILAAAPGGCARNGQGARAEDGGTGGLTRRTSPNRQLAMAFDTQDPDKRREGINLLSAKRRGLREPYLKAYASLLLADPEPSVRSAAVRALGKAGQAAAAYLPGIVDALEDKDQMVRADAAVALDAVIGEAASVPLQHHAIMDDSTEVRMSCARALRHCPQPAALKTLVNCLRDDAFCVRHQARASLVGLTGKDMGDQADAWESVDLPAAAGAKPGWWDRLIGKAGKTPPPASTEAASRPASQPAGP